MNTWLLYQTLSCRIHARSGLLPAGRRLRVPRSAPGRAGAVPRAARADARAPAALRRPAVRRGRRAALVARAVGARAAVALFGRSAVAALRGRDLRAAHRRGRGARRAVPFLDWCAAAGRRPRVLRPAADRPRDRHALRTLRAGHRQSEHGRRARTAALRLGRLERRDEPRRGAGPRREHVARLLPLRRPAATSPSSATNGSRPGWRPAIAARRRGWRPASRRPGTASGSGAATTTTARRSDPPHNDECRIDRSPSRGR